MDEFIERFDNETLDSIELIEMMKEVTDDSFLYMNETLNITYILNYNESTELYDNENKLLMPKYGFVLAAIGLALISIIGTTGNVLVIYLVAKTAQLRTPMNVFLVNLASSDLAIAGLGSTMSFIAAIYGYWPFGHLLCTFYAFGMALAGIGSITTLMVLAFERFLMIARPFRASELRIYHSLMLIISIWIFSLMLTLPPLFGWASYGPEGPHLSCSVNWESNDLSTKSYIIFLFILGLVVPIVIITVSYLGIVTTLKKISRQSTTISSRTTSRAEIRILSMVAIMIGCFLFAWLPYAILSLIIAFGNDYLREFVTPSIAALPAIFAKSSSCYNPIIYVGLNTQFRDAWYNLLRIRGRGRHEEENTAVTASATYKNVNENVEGEEEMIVRKVKNSCKKKEVSSNVSNGEEVLQEMLPTTQKDKNDPVELSTSV